MSFLLVCAKTHEADASVELLQHKLGYLFTFQSTWMTGDYHYFKSARGALSSPVQITIVHFGGNYQGGIETAIRLQPIIVQHSPTQVVMVGVCGGRDLGRVIVGDIAVDAESGRTDHDGVFFNQHSRVRLEDFDSPSFQAGSLWKGLVQKHPNACLGELWSFGAVREDVATIVDPTQAALHPSRFPLPNGTQWSDIGVEMEAFAFMRLLKVRREEHSVQTLGVVKAVSDIGSTGLKRLADLSEEAKKSNLAYLALQEACKEERVDLATALSDNRTARRAFRPKAGRVAGTLAAEALIAYIERLKHAIEFERQQPDLPFYMSQGRKRYMGL